MTPTRQKKPDRPIDDLEWLFGHAESEMGAKSNFGSFVLASKVGGKRARVVDGELVNGAQEDLFNEDALIDALDARRAVGRLAASSKHRQVMEVYRGLSARSKVVLEAFYEPRQVEEPTVREAFGALAPLARLTEAAQAIEGFSLGWLAGALERKDPRVRQIRREAAALHAAAVGAYARNAEAVRLERAARVAL